MYLIMKYRYIGLRENPGVLPLTLHACAKCSVINMCRVITHAHLSLSNFLYCFVRMRSSVGYITMALLPRLATLLLLSCTLQPTIGLLISVQRAELGTTIQFLKLLFYRDTAVSGGFNIKLFRTIDSDSYGSNIDVESEKFWPCRALPITALCPVVARVPLHHDTASIIREFIVLYSEGNFSYEINVSTEKVRPRKFLDLFNSN